MGAKGALFGVLRAILSIAGFIIPFFMTSSFMSPYGFLPSGTTGTSGTPLDSFIPFQSFMSQASSDVTSSLPLGNILPFAVGGGSSVIIWMIISQVMGHVQSLVSSRSAPRVNPADVMKSFSTNVPEKLPGDITKVQYMILRSFHQGSANPKDIEKYLSMDRKEIGKERDVLIANGYLTKNDKLTSKGLDVLTYG